LFIKESVLKTKHEEKPVAVTSPLNAAQDAEPKYSVPKNTSSSGKNLLESLRQKISSEYNIEEIKDAIALTDERLKKIWNEYTAKLEAQPNKHSTFQTFRSAKLKVEADNFFSVTVHALTQQKFVEQEKTILCDFIQQAFYNHSINFKILIDAGKHEEIPIHLTLNSRQKFERIAEKYPLVRELKDRLNLDIDY